MKANRQISVREVSGGGWSAYWKIPRGLRWLPQPEVRYGNKYVAYKASAHRMNVYFYTNCYVCGGLYLTSRNHAQYCSNRCAKEHSRYNGHSEN